MKTVPTRRVVSKPDSPAELAELGMRDLPAEVRLALTDIAGAAREGLLAMSVAAGMAVMQTMFTAEIAAACGPKGRHDPGRAAVRHGTGRGSVVLGGRRVPVSRPRARTVEGGEVPLGGPADVVVTDGFTGNVLLKGVEGAFALAGGVAPPQRVPRAAALLGVGGTVVVCHGAATGTDLASGIALAVRLHQTNLVEVRS